LAAGSSGLILACVIERLVRVANSFEEADEIDRQDVAAMSFEERISGVERLRRVWFGEDRAESRLERVLERADLPTGSARPDREEGRPSLRVLEPRAVALDALPARRGYDFERRCP
jgi:hypothetical protein